MVIPSSDSLLFPPSCSFADAAHRSSHLPTIFQNFPAHWLFRIDHRIATRVSISSSDNLVLSKCPFVDKPIPLRSLLGQKIQKIALPSKSSIIQLLEKKTAEQKTHFRPRPGPLQLRTEKASKLDDSISEVRSEQTGKAHCFAFARSGKQEDGVNYKVVAHFKMWI